MTDLKTCSRCGEQKPRAQYYKRTASPDGLNARCKVCVKAAQSSPEAVEKRRAYARNLYRTNAKYRADQAASMPERALRYLYKLTPEQLEEMHEKQDHRCAACGDLVEGRMDVDHDHACCPERRSCGVCLRELLCRRCNITLGRVRDSIKVLESLIAYLQKHDAHGY